MEIKEIAAEIKKNGQASVADGSGRILGLVAVSAWDLEKHGKEGIFLLYELFQLRSIVEPFSEVSLDIIEYATKPTIYQSPMSKMFLDGPVSEGLVRFSLLKKDFWNKLLFACSQPLILISPKDKKAMFEVKEYFPLFSAGTKELFLDGEGNVKIIKV